MTKANRIRSDGLELLGDILWRTLRKMVFKEMHQEHKRRHNMNDCFDDFDGPDWEDWMIIGPLSEDIAREKRDIERTRREWDDEDDDYWDMINRRW